MKTINEVVAGLGRPECGITFAARSAELVSYATLFERVRGNARHFATLGISRGDRVAIAMETNLEYVVALLALVVLGAVPLSLKPRRGSIEAYDQQLRELYRRFRVGHAYGSLPSGDGIAAISWDADARSTDASVVAAVGPEDLAFVQFSSGSLGDPKPVPIRHGMLTENLRALAATDQRPPDVVGYTFLPLSHDMGLIGVVFGGLIDQYAITLSTIQEFLRRPLEVFRRHERPRSMILPMPDFAIRYLVRHVARLKTPEPQLLACIRTLYCGAEPIRRSTIDELLTVAQPCGFHPGALLFSYGLAEATLMVTAHEFVSLEASFTEGPKQRIIASVGKVPDPRYEVRLGTCDASGQFAAVAPGEEGPIWIRGPSVFAGYLDSEPLRDGWYDTGDVGFERGGELYISGRTKDLLIVNGENIFPSDIEEVIASLPDVDTALVMTEDDRFYAFVVPASARTGVDTDRVREAIASRFGTAPAEIALGPGGAIIRTTSGKPVRAATLAELRRTGAITSRGA